jgi:3',5'-cyclic AMP phosphodiesterase CpdA
MRIGQLTDIHVWADEPLRPSFFLSKRVTGWVNYQRKRAHEYERRVLDAAVARLVDERPDLVVVSGDLSNLGLRSEMERARDVLAPLERAGLRIAVVPGNHDYYVAASSRGLFEEVYADWLRADARLDTPYPYVVRGEGVSVVLLNSAVPLPPFFAAGRVGPEQLDRARRLAQVERDQGHAIVLVLHHHLTPAPGRRVDAPRALRDAAAVRAFACEVGACLVLHGHNHHHEQVLLEGGPRVVGLSSSTTNRPSPRAQRGMVGCYEVDASGLRHAKYAMWEAVEGRFGAWNEDPAASVTTWPRSG